MKREEQILRRAYPDAQCFTDDQRGFAKAILDAYSEERQLEAKNNKLPSRFIRVGDTVSIGNRLFRCERSAEISLGCEACSGCDVKRLMLNCDNLQCSPFDRRDGLFVWYKKI